MKRERSPFVEYWEAICISSSELRNSKVGKPGVLANLADKIPTQSALTRTGLNTLSIGMNRKGSSLHKNSGGGIKMCELLKISPNSSNLIPSISKSSTVISVVSQQRKTSGAIQKVPLREIYPGYPISNFPIERIDSLRLRENFPSEMLTNYRIIYCKPQMRDQDAPFLNIVYQLAKGYYNRTEIVAGSSGKLNPLLFSYNDSQNFIVNIILDPPLPLHTPVYVFIEVEELIKSIGKYLRIDPSPLQLVVDYYARRQIYYL